MFTFLKMQNTQNKTVVLKKILICKNCFYLVSCLEDYSVALPCSKGGSCDVLHVLMCVYFYIQHPEDQLHNFYQQRDIIC